MEIQDSDYILYKALSEYVVKGLQNSLKNINAKCSVVLSNYEKLKSQFLNCDNFDALGENSNKLKDLQKTLISLFAVQDRINNIISRNKQRLEMINSKLELMGIYNVAVDKKIFSAAISKEDKNVSLESLNLNPNSENGVVYKFFAGSLLAFKNGRLDFSNKINGSILLDASPEFFHSVIFTFPYSLSTIPDDYFMSPHVKNGLLKETILFVAGNMKTKTISESNNELGGILQNAGAIYNISEFAKELKNYFEVSAKQCIKKNAPDLADEIDKTIRCNEASEFLPASKRVAVFSNGLAGDTKKTEEEENEEIRKDQEEEAQKEANLDDLLAMLTDDEDELEKTEEQEKIDEDAKNAEEEIKLNEEQQSKEAENKEMLDELEQQLVSSLKKNDTEEWFYERKFTIWVN